MSLATIQGIGGSQADSTNGKSELAKYVDGSKTIITADDLQGVTEIKSYRFYNNKDVTSITIPDSVTSIGEYAFNGCSNLSNIVLPTTIREVGDCAFQLTGLSEIYVDFKTYLNSFDSCYKLKTVVIDYPTIANRAFSSCYHLLQVTILGYLSMGVYPFDWCYRLVEIYSPYESPSNSNLGGYYSVSVLKIHKSLDEPSILKETPDGFVFADVGFTDCYYLVDYIGTDKDLVIPEYDNTRNCYIRQYALYDNGNITSVKLPNNVTSIHKHAFDKCTKLNRIEIPSGVTYFGEYAFRDSTSLLTMICYATTPPTLYNTGSLPKYSSSSTAKIYVPDESLSTYKNANYWSSFASRIYPLSELQE